MGPFDMILMTTGYFIITLACIITITFLVWLVKLEFEWFFDVNIFKVFSSKIDGAKSLFKKKVNRVKSSVDKENKRERVILNE